MILVSAISSTAIFEILQSIAGFQTHILYIVYTGMSASHSVLIISRGQVSARSGRSAADPDKVDRKCQ